MNISLVVPGEREKEVIQALHACFFEDACLVPMVDVDAASTLAASALSLALYDPIVAIFGLYLSGYLLTLWAGGLSGAIAIFVFNWTEVLKTQAQLKRQSLRAIGRRIYNAEGLRGFWAGG